MEEVFARFRARVAVFVVYIQEAHPSDGWRLPVTCPPDPPAQRVSRAVVANSVGVRLPSALWGRTSL